MVGGEADLGSVTAQYEEVKILSIFISKIKSRFRVRSLIKA